YSASVEKKYWSDGSLAHYGIIWRLPVTIGGSASLPITVSNGGSWPSNSSRVLSEAATSGTDIQNIVTGMDNLSGDWTFNINQGIGAAKQTIKLLDGDAGAVWMVLCSARQSGADHGQLEAYVALTLLNDASGNYGGMRHNFRICQPW